MKTEHVTNKRTRTTRIPNKLAEEKSPYLLQHAYNPVNWYPWGEEAFTKAKKENKPIFLSIGYSTCHWCHVMEKESFEDQEVAEYLNKYFVAIKVDKEERPDVDSIYMSVCQNLTGQGGWPLTILMLPSQKPFFAGTYFPKRAKYHMPGVMDLLETVQQKWETGRDEIVQSSESITDSLKKEYNNLSRNVNLSKKMVEEATHSLKRNFDKEYGGFGHAPKFPTPHNLMYLLRASYYEKDQEALEIVEKTLDSMYSGGIFDHIGYGFSRYSTDKKWLAPHFEKMLYDNALLIITYLETYQITKNDKYKQIAEKTMDYVLRELTNDEGGFYCAQDADSEGVEGKYYVFTPEEIIKVLGKEDGEYFNQYYDITESGNFEGKNIPNRIQKPLAEDEKITKLRKVIFEYRLHRTKLHKDDKILTSWNGIMIVAFAKAYQVLQDDKYLLAAKRADEFIVKKLRKENHLFVHYRDSKSVGTGHIDDYSFYIWALFELYEANFDVNYLTRAISYIHVLIDEFFDRENGGFYLYSKDQETLIHRPKELYDGAIPSGNSVIGYVLQKLTSLTENIEQKEVAESQLNFIAGGIADYPSAYCFSMMAVMQNIYPSKELICVVKETSEIKEVQKVLSQYFHPNLTVLIKTANNGMQLEKVSEGLKEYQIKDDKITFYLCENHACQAPFHDITGLEDKLVKELL